MAPVSPLNCSSALGHGRAMRDHLEANPDDITEDGLKASKRGVNRLSVGVQSLRDEELRWLGRRHDAAAAVRSVTHAWSAGFDNLSLDLIFGLPGQTVGALDEMLTHLGPAIRACLALRADDRAWDPFGVELEAGRLTGKPTAPSGWTCGHFGRSPCVGRRPAVTRSATSRSPVRAAVTTAPIGDRTFVGVGPGAHGQRFGRRARRAAMQPQGCRDGERKSAHPLRARSSSSMGEMSASPRRSGFGRRRCWASEIWTLASTQPPGRRARSCGPGTDGYRRAAGVARVLTAAPASVAARAVNRVDEVAAMLLNAQDVQRFSSVVDLRTDRRKGQLSR